MLLQLWLGRSALHHEQEPPPVSCLRFVGAGDPSLCPLSQRPAAFQGGQVLLCPCQHTASLCAASMSSRPTEQMAD